MTIRASRLGIFGLIARIKHQFSTVLATAEQARHRRASQPIEEHEEPTGIIGRIMPLFGLELLDVTYDVAALNLPSRVGQLFGVSL